MHMKPVTTRKAWTDQDVLALLQLYNQFLHYQFDGTPYTKAKPVRDLAALQGRSKGSIECKMMNISAILAMHNREWVKGYKPLPNINKALINQVAAYYKFNVAA